ncbi:MAG: insulinase family protein [Colwellia sp.]|nr:insulinase family protein [Colwellia sp.]
MTLAIPLIANIYRHKNSMKHINIISNEGFNALFVVNTPVFDNSGVAHGVEHLVFRGSKAFPQAETLFQLTSLTDAKINASTFANTSYFHCQSLCPYTFILAVNYLLNGLFNPVFNAKDLHCEIYDGKDKGVIYQELLAAEQADKNSTKESDKDSFCYGGISTLIGNLSLNDLTSFHQRFYQASNITLVTANADIEKISQLISLLPKQHNQSTQLKETLTKDNKNSQDDGSNVHHQKKYSQAINQLITTYHLWLQDPNYQEIADYKEIENAKKPLVTDTDMLPMQENSNLIPALASLSKQLVLVEETISEQTVSIDINQLPSKTPLPNLFSPLYQQAEKLLTSDKVNRQLNYCSVSEQRNALWLTKINATEQEIATLTSYIISAYPRFLAPRCQGSCYATQALTIENSAYLAIYSAFDVNPDKRLQEIPLCLLKLSQDNSFISMSLALAKIKYCRAYQVQKSQVSNITATDISAYLLVLANDPHPKV